MANIAYANVRSRELQPIDARDICTKVTLVVAGRPSGREATRVMVRDDTDTAYTHYPSPIVVEVEADEHTTYYAHKVVQLPDGVNPFLDPTDSAIPDPNHVDVGLAPALRDGDPDTNVTIDVDATVAASSIAQIVSAKAVDDTGEFVGFRIMYSFNASGEHDDLQRPVLSGERWVGVGGTRFMAAWSWWELPFSTGQADVTDLWATAHPDARGSSDGQTLDRFEIHLRGVLGEAIITHFYPLVLNTDHLENIARSHLKLPAATPSRVTVAGVVPLEAEHTIVGWPGGDLVIPVARQTYGRDETIIEVEQKSAPRGIASTTLEAASIRAQREAQARARDLYGLRMAPR